jgi:hypothetical protein
LFARHGVTQPSTDNGADMSPRPETGDPTAAARAILADFGKRAWRRPLQQSELDRLMKLFALAREQKAGFAECIKLPMKAMLVSPNFLFIGNAGATPNQDAADVRPIDEFTLAARLSYFLWSSMPDDELLGLAENGRLRSHLESQVTRMLASPKARALVDNFAGQWLEFRGLENFTPDKDAFPDFSPAIRSAMQTETATFMEYIMRNDRSISEMLTADYTFVNDVLAQYYGLPEVRGEEFVKVSLAGTPRRGILTQGSVLLLTSNPTRTSPVKRGKWVLDNLLGMPPPPPPPNVPALEEGGKRQFTGTLRQQMEQHRANPVCASCHATMDPIGFSLENFDGAGMWRDKEGTAHVDASGELVTGDKFSGAAELERILAVQQRDNFLGCVSEKILTYALGRGLEYYDRPTLDQMVDDLKRNGDSFHRIVMDTVMSYPFQMTRGTKVQLTDPPAPTEAAGP